MDVAACVGAVKKPLAYNERLAHRIRRAFGAAATSANATQPLRSGPGCPTVERVAEEKPTGSTKRRPSPKPAVAAGRGRTLP